MSLETVTIQITIGPECYRQQQYVYVWLDENGPIYVGETAQSPADRTGLHIRAPHRSGAIVAQQIQLSPRQKCTVVAFVVGDDLLREISNKYSGAGSSAGLKRARLAIERSLYEALAPDYPRIQAARGCKWQA